MDSAFGAKRWFSVYLLATALGTFLAASLLFALFSTWRPLSQSAEPVSDSVLFIAAMVGAIFSLTISVIIGATRPIDSQSEDLTGTAQHVFGRA
jgi:hypothetical protein